MNRQILAGIAAGASLLTLAGCGSEARDTTPRHPIATHSTPAKPRGPVTAAALKTELGCAEIAPSSQVNLATMLPAPVEGFGCVLPDGSRLIAVRAKTVADAEVLRTEFREEGKTDHIAYKLDRQDVWLFVAQNSNARYAADEAYRKAEGK